MKENTKKILLVFAMILGFLLSINYVKANEITLYEDVVIDTDYQEIKGNEIVEKQETDRKEIEETTKVEANSEEVAKAQDKSSSTKESEQQTSAQTRAPSAEVKAEADEIKAEETNDNTTTSKYLSIEPTIKVVKSSDVSFNSTGNIETKDSVGTAKFKYKFNVDNYSGTLRLKYVATLQYAATQEIRDKYATLGAVVSSNGKTITWYEDINVNTLDENENNVTQTIESEKEYDFQFVGVPYTSKYSYARLTVTAEYTYLSDGVETTGSATIASNKYAYFYIKQVDNETLNLDFIVNKSTTTVTDSQSGEYKISEPITYEVKYNYDIINYNGPAQVTTTITLPFAIEESEETLSQLTELGGVYKNSNNKTFTITFTKSIDSLNRCSTSGECIKENANNTYNFTVVYKNPTGPITAKASSYINLSTVESTSSQTNLAAQTVTTSIPAQVTINYLDENGNPINEVPSEVVTTGLGETLDFNYYKKLDTFKDLHYDYKSACRVSGDNCTSISKITVDEESITINYKYEKRYPLIVNYKDEDGNLIESVTEPTRIEWVKKNANLTVSNSTYRMVIDGYDYYKSYFNGELVPSNGRITTGEENVLDILYSRPRTVQVNYYDAHNNLIEGIQIPSFSAKKDESLNIGAYKKDLSDRNLTYTTSYINGVEKVIRNVEYITITDDVTVVNFIYEVRLSDKITRYTHVENRPDLDEQEELTYTQFQNESSIYSPVATGNVAKATAIVTLDGTEHTAIEVDDDAENLDYGTYDKPLFYIKQNGRSGASLHYNPHFINEYENKKVDFYYEYIDKEKDYKIHVNYYFVDIDSTFDLQDYRKSTTSYQELDDYSDELVSSGTTSVDSKGIIYFERETFSVKADQEVNQEYKYPNITGYLENFGSMMNYDQMGTDELHILPIQKAIGVDLNPVCLNTKEDGYVYGNKICGSMIHSDVYLHYVFRKSPVIVVNHYLIEDGNETKITEEIVYDNDHLAQTDIEHQYGVAIETVYPITDDRTIKFVGIKTAYEDPFYGNNQELSSLQERPADRAINIAYTGTWHSRRILNLYYVPNTSIITVHHVTPDGKYIEHDKNGNSIVYRNPVKGIIGDNYSEEPYSIKPLNIYGYKNIATNGTDFDGGDNATIGIYSKEGVFTEEGFDIFFVYEEAVGKVVVHYVDTEDNVLAEPVELTDKVGENYDTTDKIIPIDGYFFLNTKPGNVVKGKYTEDQIDVYYVYMKGSHTGSEDGLKGDIFIRKQDGEWNTENHEVFSGLYENDKIDLGTSLEIAPIKQQLKDVVNEMYRLTTGLEPNEFALNYFKSRISLDNVNSVFTTELTIPKGIKLPESSDSYKLLSFDGTSYEADYSNGMFQLIPTSISEDGTKVTITMVLKDQEYIDDTSELYTQFVNLEAKLDAEPDYLTFIIYGAEIESGVKNQTLTITGDVNGSLDADAIAMNQNRHFRYDWGSTQNHTEPTWNDAKDAVITDSNNHNIQLTLEVLAKGKVITHYVDKDTNESIATDEENTYSTNDSYTTTKKEITDYTYVSDTGNTTGTFTEDDIEVTYYYVKNNGTVTVHYKDQKTGEDLPYTLEELTGRIGTPYETVKKEFPNTHYEYKEVVGPTTGNYSSEPVEVIYYYVWKQGTVEVHHVDAETKEELTEQPDVLTGDVDSDYTALAKDIEHYTLTSDSGNRIGTYTEEDIEVTFYYTRNTGKVIVHYVDADTNEELDTVEKTGKVETGSYTTEIKPFENYTPVEEYEPETVTFTEETQEITYKYTKNLGLVIVHYVDKDTNEEIETVRITDKKIDEAYTTEQKEFTDYHYVDKSDNTVGVVTATETNVYYYYEKDNGTVIVHHIGVKDETEKELDSESLTGKIGSDYTTSPKEFEHYTLDQTRIPEAGKFVSGSINVYYYYTWNKGQVVVHYVADDQDEELETVTLDPANVDSKYETEAKEFTSYRLTGDSGNRNGVVTEGQTDVYYYYTRLESDVTVHYVDADTNEELDTEYGHGKVGETYTLINKDFENYTLVSRPEGETVTYTEEPIELTYTYKKNSGSITVYYKDLFTGKEIEGVETKNEPGYVDQEYNAEPIDIEGYKYIRTEGNEELIGNYPNGENYVFTHYYQRVGKVVTHYYEIDSTTKVAEDVEQSGPINEIYMTTPAEDVEGYSLVETPENANGRYAEELTEVIYYYQKLGKVITHYLDNNGNVLADSTESTGVVGEGYTTNPAEVEGYEVTGTPENATGEYTKEDINVTYIYTKVTEPETVYGNVHVKHITLDGKVLEENTITLEVGQTYETKELDTEEYELVLVSGDQTGTIEVGTKEVLYVYKEKEEEPSEPSEPEQPKTGKVVVLYTDTEGYELLKPVEIPGNVGDEYITSQPKIDGYKIYEVKGEKRGKIVAGTTYVEYIYEKVEEPSEPTTPDIEKGTVIAYYVDENGNSIADPMIIPGTYGTTYITYQKVIPGYTGTSIPENRIGKIEQELLELYYEYAKNEETPSEEPGSSCEGNCNCCNTCNTCNCNNGENQQPQIIININNENNSDNHSENNNDNNVNNEVNNDTNVENNTDVNNENNNQDETNVNIENNPVNNNESSASAETGDTNVTTGDVTTGDTNVTTGDTNTNVTTGDQIVNTGDTNVTTGDTNVDNSTNVETGDNNLENNTTIENNPTNNVENNTDVDASSNNENNSNSESNNNIENNSSSESNPNVENTNTSESNPNIDLDNSSSSESNPNVENNTTVENNPTNSNENNPTNNVDVDVNPTIGNENNNESNPTNNNESNPTNNNDGSNTNVNDNSNIDTCDTCGEKEGEDEPSEPSEPSQPSQPDTPKVGKVIVKYVDEEGYTISPMVTIPGNVDDEYSTDKLRIAGYEYDDVEGNTEGQIVEGTTYVTYKYKVAKPVQGKVIVHFRDEEGKTLASDQLYEGLVGESYTILEEYINGYELTKIEKVEQPTKMRLMLKRAVINEDLSKGNYTVEDTELVYIYTKVEEEPKEDDKQCCGTTVVVNCENNCPDVQPCEPSDPSEPEEPTPTAPAEEEPKTGTVVITYIDMDGNEIHESKSIEGEVNTPYTTQPEDIEGYTYKTSTGETAGTIIVGEKQIVYIYTKNPAPEVKKGVVVAHYVDTLGNKIAGNVTFRGTIGTGYETFAKLIENYNFVKVIGDTKGTYTEEDKEVTYVYSQKKSGEVAGETEEPTGTGSTAEPDIKPPHTGVELNILPLLEILILIGLIPQKREN